MVGHPSLVNPGLDTWLVAGKNVWSLFKHSVIGSYHKISTKHPDAYLNELEWRFNNRNNPYLFRDTLLKLIRSENLPYQELTSQAAKGNVS